MCAGPAQLQCPAARRRQVDDRRPRAAWHGHRRGARAARERGLDDQVRRGERDPGHPEDLVGPVSQRRRVQRVAGRPQDRHDVARRPHHMRHGQVRRGEPGPRPDGERADRRLPDASVRSGRDRRARLGRRRRSRMPGHGRRHRRTAEHRGNGSADREPAAALAPARLLEQHVRARSQAASQAVRSSRQLHRHLLDDRRKLFGPVPVLARHRHQLTRLHHHRAALRAEPRSPTPPGRGGTPPVPRPAASAGPGTPCWR